MLAFSTTASISGADSTFVHDDDAGTVSTPTGRDPGYCPCPSGWVAVSAPLSVFMIDPRDVIAYSRFFMFGPWCRGEPALTMASADVWWPIPSPLGAGSTVADHQTSQGKTRDLPPIYPPHLPPHLPDSYWASSVIALSPRCGCLICDSCSSGREFAFSFLQIPPRGGHPCCSASGSRYQGPQGTFTPKSSRGTTLGNSTYRCYAPCLAHNENRRPGGGGGLLGRSRRRPMAGPAAYFWAVALVAVAWACLTFSSVSFWLCWTKSCCRATTFSASPFRRSARSLATFCWPSM